MPARGRTVARGHGNVLNASVSRPGARPCAAGVCAWCPHAPTTVAGQGEHAAL